VGEDFILEAELHEDRQEEESPPRYHAQCIAPPPPSPPTPLIKSHRHLPNYHDLMYQVKKKILECQTSMEYVTL